MCKLKFGDNSIKEDALMRGATSDVESYLTNNLVLPEGFRYERTDFLSYEDIKKYLISRGFPESKTAYLDTKNPKGGDASIKPDSTILAAVKRNSANEVIEWYPILIGEAKYQKSSQGNAIERFFKNYDVVVKMFRADDIVPYICFCQGAGFESEFIKNKLRGGLGNDVNPTLDCHKDVYEVNGETIKEAVGLVYTRTVEWSRPEMFAKMLMIALQSLEYYFGKELFGEAGDPETEANLFNMIDE